MKREALAVCLLIALLSPLFSLLQSGVVSAIAESSILEPSVPQFTLKYVDNSYDVPPKTTSSTDPYTGKTTTTTTPSYHVESKTIQATIKNNIGASYYNFRYKGHYADEWSYEPFDPDRGYFLGDFGSVPYQASNSSHTVATLPSILFNSVTAGGLIDVQVQALFGNFDATPYGHFIDVGGPTYDFRFEGTTSDWSDTQTVVFGESETPTPSVPEFPSFIVLPALLGMVLLSALLFKKRSGGQRA